MDGLASALAYWLLQEMEFLNQTGCPVSLVICD